MINTDSRKDVAMPYSVPCSMYSIVVCVGFWGILCSVSFAQTQLKELRLIPWPAEIEAKDGDFTPAGELVIAVVEDDAVSKEIAETLAEDLKALKFKATVKAGDAPNGAISIKIIEDESMGSEAYRLEVADIGISIIASEGDGLFWGTRTALQLLAAGPDKSVPCLSIKDKPQFTHRGLLLDPARNFHTMDFLLETVKNLSAYKMNRLQIHFSDNDGYRLPSKKFPKLPTVAANGQRMHYTEEEIAKLVAMAKKYHVTIVPEVEMPGHARGLTAAIPELRCNPKIDSNEVCIGSEESYKILQGIIEEVMEMIPGPYWHLGGDETNHGMWINCPQCKAKMAAEGFKDTSELYNYFLNRMNRFVRSKGRQMMVWDGFDPYIKPVVDKNIIVYPFDINLRKNCRPMDYLDNGYTVVNTSWKPLYVVCHMYVATPQELADWNVFQFKSYHDDGKFGVYPMTGPWEVEPTSKVLGAQMCSWDLPNDQKFLPGWLFNIGPAVENKYNIKPAPRIQLVSERLWTGSVTKPEDLLRRAGVKPDK